jgi:hypothetical protein
VREGQKQDAQAALVPRTLYVLDHR